MKTEHGTYAGYKKHYRDHTPYCQPCRDAQADYARMLYNRPLQEHGTANGLVWHTRMRVAVCDLCLYYATKTELEQARAYRRGAA